MLGTTLLGESFTWSILAGMALILAGVITGHAAIAGATRSETVGLIVAIFKA